MSIQTATQERKLNVSSVYKSDRDIDGEGHSSLDRSHLERGIDMLGPRMTTLLFTSMTGIISPRLHIHYDDVEDGVGFPALVQWASLFHRGQLSEKTFANNQMDIGTGPADPSHYQIVWRAKPDSVVEDLAITRVLHVLRNEMAEIARSPAPMAHIDLYAYNWLAGDNASGIRDRLQRAKDDWSLRLVQRFHMLKRLTQRLDSKAE